MAREPAQLWWDLVLDGRLHHLDVLQTPLGSLSSLRTGALKQARDRRLRAATHLPKDEDLLYVQAWSPLGWYGFSNTAPMIRGHVDDSFPVEDYYTFSREVPRPPRQRPAPVPEAEDPDLIQEREHCTCGLGNASGAQVHEPSCKVWG
jgi:hypothetical protein